MVKADRQVRLIETLQQRGESVRITELSHALGVTPMTIRRDVAELAQQGRVTSAHGSVRLLGNTVTSEMIYHVKLNEEADVKDALARQAVTLIDNGMTVFLDGGTTVGAVAKYLLDRRLTVVTNALNVANVLVRSRHVRLIVIGGTFRRESLTFLGPSATKLLQDLRLDLAIMGTEGFDWTRGFEVPDESDAEFKRLAVQSATQAVVLAAATKFGKHYLYRFATWDHVHRLITSHSRLTEQVPAEHQAAVLVVRST